MCHQNQVIVVSGERARETFFAARGLDLEQGFKILSGAVGIVRYLLTTCSELVWIAPHSQGSNIRPSEQGPKYHLQATRNRAAKYFSERL